MLLADITAHELFTHFIREARGIGVRYLAFATPLFLLFYVWKKRAFFKYKIQQKYPNNKNIIREIGYSLLSIGIFSLVSSVVFILRRHGYTKIYYHLSDHSTAYFIFSVIAFIVVHDTYFYWGHRFMHWKKIYLYVHKIHHLSSNPTPWAAFAFHPLEAFVEVGILPIMVFLIPLHPLAIVIWLLYQFGMNVLGHLGFELYPSGFVSHKITKWHNTSTHHNMHHKYVTSNYGLYFNFWDRIMGTNHERYEQVFEEVKERSKQQPLNPRRGLEYKVG